MKSLSQRIRKEVNEAEEKRQRQKRLLIGEKQRKMW